MGSTRPHTSDYMSHRLSTLQSKRTKPGDDEEGIYFNKEFEFESTTELRGEPVTKKRGSANVTCQESSGITTNKVREGR